MKGGSTALFSSTFIASSSLSSSRNFPALRLPVSRSTLNPAPVLFHRRSSRIPIPNHRNLHNPLRSAISTAASATMAASFSPEKARVPPAIQLPSPPISKFKIGLCQLSVMADKEKNIAHARVVIEEAAEKGAKLILLPEIWNSPYSNDSFPVYAEDIDAGGDASPSTAMLSEVASLLKVTIVGGSIPERSGDKLYNTCCVFGTDGKLLAKHRKIHLFDINIPGKITFEESKTLTAGATPTIVDTVVSELRVVRTVNRTWLGFLQSKLETLI